jgi:hypothetical protein
VGSAQRRRRRGDEECGVRIREVLEDVAWLILIVMLLLLAVPFVALAFAMLLGQRLYRQIATG